MMTKYRQWDLKLLTIACLLLLAGIERASLGADLLNDGPDGQRANAWSARTSTGRVFTGTWTAQADPETGAVTGTWTLDGAKGRAVARGGWSAAKAPKGWKGEWRAVVSGRKGEYSGTWSADVDLEPDARFSELFELAARKVVSGGFRAGSQSGAWSIRAAN